MYVRAIVALSLTLVALMVVATYRLGYIRGFQNARDTIVAPYQTFEGGATYSVPLRPDVKHEAVIAFVATVPKGGLVEMPIDASVRPKAKQYAACGFIYQNPRSAEESWPKACEYRNGTIYLRARVGEVVEAKVCITDRRPDVPDVLEPLAAVECNDNLQ